MLSQSLGSPMYGPETFWGYPPNVHSCYSKECSVSGRVRAEAMDGSLEFLTCPALGRSGSRKSVDGFQEDVPDVRTNESPSQIFYAHMCGSVHMQSVAMSYV